MYNKKPNNILMDNMEKAIIHERETVVVWRKYVTELFEDDKSNLQIKKKVQKFWNTKLSTS